ncbi:TetR/AcrR family transcriptional regulator [Paenibacillus thalictri]|uniref:TetR/AcrR family transcriptional regulator n=1 Tax=Paenibacillus thalictri TaxID=2527873 RepID=A0A4Q9DEL1_9BACL|nr:TetR/AcrR family transcriptional regulator [Paenibacillus thalictri]TBL69327.1 TetR/AcrR family transcriptional regulator [Paenibacillus thalictri]
MARKAVAQELSRERILEEARGLFVTHGYRSLTMRSIAKTMGYSHGALYYHFKEKAELFHALVSDDFNMLLSRSHDIIGRTRLGEMAQLERLMLEFIKFGLENPNHYEIMFMIKDPELQQYSRTEKAQCLDLFATVVRAILTKRADADDRIYSAPWSLFMSMHGFISYSINFNQTYDEVKKLAEAHVKYLCEGLLGRTVS